MRLTRSMIVTILALGVVVAVSMPAVAQDAVSMSPAAALGWALNETHLADGESEEVDGAWVREGVAYTYVFNSTDPRLSGSAVWTGTGHRYPTEPVFEVQAATWEVSNDEGGWSGTSTALVGNGLGDTEAITLTGSGGYEGLTAYLVMTWSRSGASFRGAIFPGEMPAHP